MILARLHIEALNQKSIMMDTQGNPDVIALMISSAMNQDEIIRNAFIAAVVAYCAECDFDLHNAIEKWNNLPPINPNQ